MREWLHRGEASSHTSWGAPPGQAVTLKPPVLQVNRFNKSRDRALLLTDRHLYKLEPGRQYRVMRAVPLDAVSQEDIILILLNFFEMIQEARTLRKSLYEVTIT